MLGLLDSGSVVTILGNNSHKQLLDNGLSMCTDDKLVVSTAGKHRFSTLGYILLPILYENSLNIIKAHVVPEIDSALILGIDFWKAFSICPNHINSINYISDSETEPSKKFQPSVEYLHSYEDLDTSQRDMADKITERFKEIAFERKGLGRTNIISHKIDTGNAEPIRQRYYRLSPEKQRLIAEQVNEMLVLDVIEPCESPWSSPVLLVAKKDGQPRFCLDSRKLNSVTKKDAYSLPYVAEILDNLRDAKFLSSIDLSKAFWQLPINEPDRDKTAFYVQGRGTFRFKVTAFGLTNAPATQQRLVDMLFGPEFELKVFAYLDDIIIISQRFDDHVSLLLRVLNKLKTANLSINLEKSKFFRSKLNYLGYVVDSQGLRTDPEKVSAIVGYPTPTNKKELKRFLGTASWYRRFIPNFSTIAGPLNSLTTSKKSASSFLWTLEAEKSFSDLKSLLVQAPVLA